MIYLFSNSSTIIIVITNFIIENWFSYLSKKFFIVPRLRSSENTDLFYLKRVRFHGRARYRDELIAVFVFWIWKQYAYYPNILYPWKMNSWIVRDDYTIVDAVFDSRQWLKFFALNCSIFSRCINKPLRNWKKIFPNHQPGSYTSDQLFWSK